MKKLLGVVSAVVSFFALLGVSLASFWVVYQPKAPKCLERE